MNHHVLAAKILLLLSLTATAQTISTPTKTSTEPSPAQLEMIREGIQLHDAGKYDEAIHRYQLVLKDNPNCTLALYELAFSLIDKGEKDLALEIAQTGISFQSRELPSFYILIANITDDRGNPTRAIYLYNEAIRILLEEKTDTKALGSVYFNLGVTYSRLNRYRDSREAFKQAVHSDYGYPSPNFLLSESYMAAGYKIPALLAAMRFATMEFGTPRSQRAAELAITMLKPTERNHQSGGNSIKADINGPKDEGEFAAYEKKLGGLTAFVSEKDTGKTNEEKFAEGVDELIVMIGGDSKIRDTFVGRKYIPFLVEARRLGYSRFLAYILLSQSGNENATRFLLANKLQTDAFIEWAYTYRP